MINNKNSRRSFLSSMAILSAGAALGSPSTLFSSTGEKWKPEEKWKKFWQLQGGELHFNQTVIPDVAVNSVCKNYTYQTGEVIYFQNEEMFAQPIWIYWGNQKSSADDVIITFFANNKEHQKILRINCFELDSLYHLTTEKKERNLISLLKEDAATVSKKGDNVTRKVIIKTLIQKERPAKISACLAERTFTIERKFIYNV